MAISKKLFLLTVGFLFCLFGCDSEQDHLLQPDDLSSEDPQTSLVDPRVSADIEASFEQNLLPILAARCAYAGCHDAGGALMDLILVRIKRS